ncbi:major facilitator superfamily domain-containing protein [Aspergillus tetrazonus]
MADDIKPGSDALQLEKPTVETMEGGYPASRMSPARRAEVEKSMKRKLDARCSLFVLIYIMNYLDRNNMAAARLKGLQEDLNMNYDEYATCLSILYVGYILMQVPSNILINRIQRPSLYISLVMTLWGLISTLSGVVHNFSGMVAIRFFLGFVEAAFLPGALMILSKWYTRRELTTRNAILFCGNLISNAFSALIGAGVLSNMQGVLGHAAWRWLFWIEGAATMTIAIAAAIILPDLPTNTRGFTQEELEVAQLRMTEDVGEADVDSEDSGPWDGFFMAIKDVKMYIMMLTLTAYVVGLSFNAFFPSLTETLGFAYVPTLLMSAPPWVFSCLFSLCVAWSSDRYQEKVHCCSLRRPLPPSRLIRWVRSILSLSFPHLLILLTSFIVFYSWISTSFPRPPAKRAVAIAMVNAFSQLGNVAGSYVWDLKENGYRKSYGIVTAMFGVAIVGCLIFKLILEALNKKLAEAEAVEVSSGAGAAQQGGMHGGEGDMDESLRMHKGFRYLV